MVKILVASHAGVLEVNRAVYVELARLGFEVSFLVPESWRGDLIQNLHFQKGKSEENCRFFTKPLIFSGNGSLFFYKSLAGVPKDFDLLIIDEEPWSLAALQLSLWAGNRTKIFYTKQNLKKTIPWVFRLLEKVVFHSSFAALSVESEVEEVLHWKGYSKKIFDFPHSYDPALFHPLSKEEKAKKRIELGLDPEKVTLLYCGRLTEEKGILDFLSVLRKIEYSQLQCLIVGNGPLESRIKTEFQGKPFFKLLPAIPHLQVGRTMALGDILVLPSKTQSNWKEQFGRVIVEAIACGLVVVGSDSGAIARVIDRCGGGRSFREGNVEEFLRVTTTLIQNEELRKSLQEKGRQFVSQNLSHEALAKSLASIIRSIKND